MGNKNRVIVVVDFGAQYAHLIARRVRQLGVYSEILLPEANLSEFKGCKGIILSGGPNSVYGENAPKVDKGIFELGVPVLGLCYGHQLMAFLLGGKVSMGNVREYGTASLEIDERKGLFSGLEEKEPVWMSHGDKVEEMPAGFEAIAKTSDCKSAAMANFDKRLFGLQFHPEVTHTPHGMKILENFVFGVCKCEKNWSMKNFLEQKVEEIKERASGKNVFLLASGGVDSTVALALLDKALGQERVYSLHVDTGFMRKKESESVDRALKELGFGNFHVVQAEKEFFESVEGIAEPEKKRVKIGSMFVEVQARELKKLDLNPDEWLLGQGTIYPDTIESAGTKHAAKIKTHHNRVPIIEELIKQGKIIEPISQLYKDEVRALGEELGLAKALVWRHPFPGPGLAIRCLCSDGKEGVIPDDLNERASAVVSEFGFKATVLPIKSVGVQGDARTYSHPAVLQGPLDWEKLEKASTLLTNSFSEINRCVYAVSPEKIESVELVEAYLTKERIEVLQEADAISMKTIEKHGLLGKIWQFPTITLPLKFNGEGEAVVLRPVESKEAMTAKFYPMEEQVLKEIAEKILALQGVNAVLYDVTHKPPGTIEWE